MATVNSVDRAARTPHLFASLERRDYLAAMAVGLVAAALTGLRLGMLPLQHASLDPHSNRHFLFGIIEHSAATLGNGPTVALAGLLVGVVTLQVTLFVKQPRGAN